MRDPDALGVNRHPANQANAAEQTPASDLPCAESPQRPRMLDQALAETESAPPDSDSSSIVLQTDSRDHITVAEVERRLEAERSP
eukprot:5967879-Pleurochrysis_carterae.AAC.1